MDALAAVPLIQADEIADLTDVVSRTARLHARHLKRLRLADV